MPRAGEAFRRAARLKIEGTRRRKLVCLIAAYHDAGLDPSLRELGDRIGVPRHRWLAVEQLLLRLERDGWLTIERGSREKRHRYVLHLDREDA